MGKFKYSMQNILDIKIKLETQAKNGSKSCLKSVQSMKLLLRNSFQAA